MFKRPFHTLTMLLLALALLAGVLPAQAQGGNPAVADEGNNIYLVDGTKGPIPNLLPADEVAKIAALQSAPREAFYQISAISPDDQTTLLTSDAGVDFLALRDGSKVHLKPLTSARIFGTLADFFWLDENSIGVYALTDATPGATLLAFDRRTGEGRIVGSLPNITQLPVLTSPDGRKVLLASIPPPDSADQAAALVVNLPGASNAKGAHTTLRQALIHAGFFQAAPAGSRTQALLDLAALFDPFPESVKPIIAQATELAVLDTTTGEVRSVTTIPAGAFPAEASFSQDGSQLAVALEQTPTDPQRGRYDGALISDQGYRDVTGNLPPAQNPILQGNRLLTLDFPSGKVRELWAKDGDGALYTGVSWSPNNQTLLVVMQTPGRLVGRRYPQYVDQFRSGAHLRFLNGADLREIRRLEQVEFSQLGMVANFVSPDEVIIKGHSYLDSHPWYYNLRSGELRNLADRAGTYALLRPTRYSRELAFAFTSYTDPVEIYRMNWDGTGITRLTWINEGVRQLSQTKQQPVAFTLRDGSTHRGVLLMPKDAPFPPKNLPIVVWQSGGPTVAVSNAWDAVVEDPFALLPNFGFGVLVVPLYGRYGAGAARFAALAHGTNFGQIDIDAQAEIVAQMRAKGWTSKVGIVGCSYGGYFTSQSVTRHPTTYAAANTQCTIVDLITEWSRGYDTLAPWMEGLPPQAALEEYRRDSPAYNANRVRTPLLAFHGTKDFLPVTLMENFMLQIINNKVPAKLLKFAGTGHGIPVTSGPLEKPYELYAAQEQLIWFRTYLMGQ